MIDFMVIFWILLLSQKNRARHHTRKRTDETSLACASDYVVCAKGQLTIEHKLGPSPVTSCELCRVCPVV